MGQKWRYSPRTTLNKVTASLDASAKRVKAPQPGQYSGAADADDPQSLADRAAGGRTSGLPRWNRFTRAIMVGQFRPESRHLLPATGFEIKIPFQFPHLREMLRERCGGADRTKPPSFATFDFGCCLVRRTHCCAPGRLALKRISVVRELSGNPDSQ